MLYNWLDIKQILFKMVYTIMAISECKACVYYNLTSSLVTGF